MASRKQQLTSALTQFYNQPVAKVSLELFVSIGAVIFFAVFAIRPTLLTMSDLVKEIEDKRQLDQKLNQKLAALNTVQTSYLSLQDELPVLDEAVPPNPDLENVLKIIEKVASENQMVITDMAVKEVPEAPAEDLPLAEKERITLPIAVSVAGDFTTIRSFINGLRANRRSLFVDSIIFAVSDEKGQKKLKATITVNMSYFGVKK